ncbi:Uncharacterized protein HZ326_22237 [Fusarium oxysporum f. sp. albedinis]|nr:Uncharacterized protein HZ326_22237 [Fusarium oxysporum f. sp. albedinis]
MIQNGSKRQKPVVSRHCWNMYPDLKQIYIARCELSSPQIPCKADLEPVDLPDPLSGAIRLWARPLVYLQPGSCYGVVSFLPSLLLCLLYSPSFLGWVNSLSGPMVYHDTPLSTPQAKGSKP